MNNFDIKLTDDNRHVEIIIGTEKVMLTIDEAFQFSELVFDVASSSALDVNFDDGAGFN